MMSDTPKILVTGALGQIGSELVTELRNRFGTEQVIASDLRAPPDDYNENGSFEQLDVLKPDQILAINEKYGINQIYHLAAILSAVGEQKPQLAWNVNMNGLLNILEIVKNGDVQKLFWPSSIAVFGPTTPRNDTEQFAITEPTTVYGISKLAGERWVEYYHDKYDLDIRSVRYPGLISYKTKAGGGTTDYAVEIFAAAIREGSYTCFLNSDTVLPMMYMPDAINGTLDLMEADEKDLQIRSSYNFNAFSFSPNQLAALIKNHIPGFTIEYAPDFRQKLADTWPQTIDDKYAREDWKWEQQFDLESMVSDMLDQTKLKLLESVE